MASGKKGKKTKGKTVDLNTFLQDTPGPLPPAPVRKNWADEVEDTYDGVYESRAKTSIVLPTAPKASRDYEDISDMVPKEPPYMAYLSNLPYDVEEDEIELFFKNMKISRMNIPRDERTGEFSKAKGFGYVEFADRDSLLNALVLPDTTLKNRRIRIEVSTNSENDKRRGGRMDMMNKERDGTFDSDWRSAPRTEYKEPERRQFNRDNRDFNRDNRDRDTDNSSGAWRDEERVNRDNDRNFSRGGGGGRDHDSDRDRDRNSRFGDRRGGGGFNSERRGFGGDRDRDRYADSERSEPRQRPRLNLAPRTLPVEKVVAPPSEASSAPAPSIFGSAKPVDTSEKDRQIEERLAKEHIKRDSSRERRIGRDDDRDEPRERREIRREHSPPRDERSSSPTTRSDDDERRPSPKPQDSTRHIDDKRIEKPPAKREERKDRPEREMPKLKEQDAPNFAQNNKYAFLEAENSD